LLPAIVLLKHVCLLAVAVTCASTDLAKGKLYNGVTLPAVGIGLALAFILDARTTGFPTLITAAEASAVGGGLILLLYLLGGMGAGDVKLMAAVGALAPSVAFVLVTLVYTALVGAAIAIGVLIWQGRLLAGLKSSARTFFTFRSKTSEGAPPLTVPYGVAIGIGTVWAWMEFVF
jgi:prepilin peptidase CpaA